MNILIAIIQVIIAAGIINVWFLRFQKASPYRGGDARNMVQEFATYGLPQWSVFVIGFLKVLSAILLLVGLWIPVVTMPAAIVLGLFMLGAVLMHLKVGDPPKKSIPAGILLISCIIVASYSAYCACGMG